MAICDWRGLVAEALGVQIRVKSNQDALFLIVLEHQPQGGSQAQYDNQDGHQKSHLYAPYDHDADQDGKVHERGSQISLKHNQNKWGAG